MSSVRSSELESWPSARAARHRLVSLLAQTRLVPPRLKSDVILRPHLLEQLNAGLDAPLTFLRAPAGYGKTTLLVQWLQQFTTLSQPVAWLSLDAHDNDLAVFVSGLSAAFQRAMPDIFWGSASMLHAPQLPLLQDIAALLLDDLADVPEDVLVVLDDYHLIQAREIHILLTELVDHLPHHVHVVLASRTEPPLPLARWRAGGKVHELHPANLRFTLQETQRFLTNLVGNEVADQTADALVEHTEGWVAMLRLAALSLHNTPDRVDFLNRLDLARDRNLSEYLFEEALAQFAPDTQEVLMRLSLLESMNAELVAATLGTGLTVEQVQEILDEWDRSNLFIVPLDTRQQWYRLHHLIKQILKQRLLARVSSQEITDLHRRASSWYARQGLIDEALEHALAAGDASKATQLVEAHIVSAYEQEQWRQMERWLHLLPEEQIQSSPFLLIARAWVLQFQGQFKEYQRSLMAADQLFAASESREHTLDDPKRQLLHALIAIEWCRTYFSRGEVQAGLESARAALEWIPPDHGYIKTYAMEFLTLFYQFDGQEEVALATLRQALQDHAAHPTSTARLLIAQAFVYLLSGKLPQLEQTAQHLQRLAQQAELKLSQPTAHWFLGVVSYECNDLEAAVYHFSAVIANQHLSRTWVAHDAMCMLALSYQAQGLRDRAKETAHTLLARVQEEHNRVQLMMAYVFCGQLALLQNEVEEAQQWLDLAGDQAVTGPMFFFDEPPVRARLLLTRGDKASVAQGQSILRHFLQQVETVHNMRKTISVLGLQAWAYELQGRRPEATAVLEQALERARPNGFIRTFANVPGLAPVLEHVRKRRKATRVVDEQRDAYLQRILVAMISPPGNALTLEERMRHDGLEPLTERELQILHLLARDRTNKEIARELVVTPGTVKVHTNNLYRKLSVDHRRAAVTLAKALGLLVTDQSQ